ncbi:hypothetical protein PC129_g19616 [Phytophthora cactorum]|uniref:Integrase catalytic domain-containing protein n=1 Tax=Phytophthora cactorum TaxID=29920 RepID=A0A8T1HB23_9STRA|nr:hypothetical protein Pcac1_g24584 [Phytophthora cactorum]KAG2882243.1 hypothetical protein PC114_g21130 [Phytophthora cactorum]KAG2976419.1 hypothetical protein PC119_g22197 [Phytophthora cactorum]KAG3019753.1 hypothetical protein PC120_g9696 [Phytophthora cactorum]KAG3190379.1 hypothetical protein PC128_g11359 [Phytophthora cactorum]
MALGVDGLYLRLPPDAQGRSGVQVFVDRFNKMADLISVPGTVTAANTAVHFVDAVFRHHALPEPIVSDRDVGLHVKALRVVVNEIADVDGEPSGNGRSD